MATLASLWLLGAFIASGEAPPVKVFVLAGQSNMSGRGDARDLPPELRRPQASILYYYDCSFSSDKGPPFSQGGSYSSDGWVPLAPCRKHPSTAAEHFGPEITFAQVAAARWPKSRIAIIKMGRGGTTLADDWNPGASAGKRLYERLLNLVAAATEKLREEGAKYEIAGIVWLQGEGDAGAKARAESYAANLTTLLSKFRRNLGDPNLPVVIGLSRSAPGNPKMPFAEMIRSAQRQAVAEDAAAQLLMADDLPMAIDGIHFSSAGLLELGRRCGRAIPER